MKKIALLFVFLVAIGSWGQTPQYLTRAGGMRFPQVGLLLNQTTWSGLSGYSTRGTTPTVSGSALAFSGGALGFSQSLDWVSTNSYATANPNWTQVITETAGTVGASSYGIGLGIRSLGSLVGQADISMMCYVDLSSGAQAGKAIIFDNQAGTTYQLAISSSALSFSAGNNVELTCTRSYATITVSARNLTTGSAPVSTTFTYSLIYTGTTINMPNTGHYAVYNLGGGQTLTSYSIQSQMSVGVPIVQIGDSKTAGYWQGTFGSSVAGLVNAGAPSVTLAGAGDRIASVSARLPEIAQVGAKYAILEIGFNDIGGGLPAAEASYQTLVTSLVAQGLTVFHLVEYSSSIDQTAWLAWLQSTYGSNVIYPPLSTYSSSYVLADGIHPTPAGATIIANSIFSFLRTSLGTSFTQALPANTNFVPYYGLDSSGNYQIGVGLIAPSLVATGTGNVSANQTFLGFASGNALIDSFGPDGSTWGGFQFNAYTSNNGTQITRLQITPSGDSIFNGAIYALGTGSIAASRLFLGYSGSQSILASMGPDSSTHGTFTLDSYTSVGGLLHQFQIDGSGNGTLLGGLTVAGKTATVTVASGSLALATSAIASAACQTVTAGSVNSATATGTASTDSITFTPNGSIKAVTGYVPSTTGGLTITAYPTTNNVNFDVCNWSASSITPGAVTVNWKVTR